jgi:PAS domain S-box-containing protein
MRGYDWAVTSLGPSEMWPHGLKAAVRIMLTTRHPVFIFWGADYLCFYNDAFAASLGPEKHPSILGKPAREAWAEAYSIVEPELDQVMAGGEACWHENYLIPIKRHGRMEEVYWTYSYSPIHEPDTPNGVGGVLVLITETTREVVARQASEERHRTLFHSMDEGFCVLELIPDQDGRPTDCRYIEVNPAFEKQTGLKDALGRTVRELIPEIEPSWFDMYGQVAQTGEPIRFVNHAQPLGKWFDVNAFPVEVPGKRHVGALFNDITERKRAEEAQHQSEERLRNTFAIETVAVMFWDECFRLTEVNGAFLRMTGFRREDALGRSWRELTPAEFHASSFRAIAEVTTRGEITPYEKQYFRKDGTRWWGLFAGRKIGDEVVEFVLDITARKEAEAALRESEARFRHLADSAPALIWMTDEEGRVTFANMHYEHMFGRPAADMLDGGWADIVLPEDLERHTRTFFDAFRVRAAFHCETRVLDRNGQVRWLRCEGVPRLDDGHRFLGYTGCNVDITDAKVAEEHHRLLINELNHRVKNTLATVQSIASQTLRNASTSAEARDALEARLIALSRAHDVLTRENWEGAWIHEVVTQAISPFLGEGGRRFHHRGTDVRLPPRTALALAMAFQELATNAVKYGALSNGKGEIHLVWLLDHTSEVPRLFLRWEERGGPEVVPPSRRGFGSRLIERSLAQDLGGEVKIVFAPTGVVCTVDAPLPKMAAA